MHRSTAARLWTAAACAAVALALPAAATASADPFGHGGSDTWTLTGTCDGDAVTLTHPPGGSSVAFEDGRVSIAHRLVFYQADGTTVRFVYERPSYDAMVKRGKLIYCDLVGSSDAPPVAADRRVVAWVQEPR